jgi:mono/diheme cytochrome c family protein
MRFTCKSVIAMGSFAFASSALTFAADISIGHREYDRNCIMCHGATGRGNGWLAENLTQPVPSLTQLKKKNGGVFPVEQVRQVIDGRTPVKLHGPRHMPIWGNVYFQRAQRELGPGNSAYDDDEVVQAKILALIDYISTLQE